MTISAVFMAGGFGSRLWPMSRLDKPKQFLPLNGELSMLQSTAKRILDLHVNSTVTICNEDHRFLVASQLQEVNSLGSVILEPCGRNTAPAIALAALTLTEDSLMLVLAADHVIKDEAKFVKIVSDSIPLAENGKLVTFGIVPTDANTGYGYIKRGDPLDGGFSVNQFTEKPDAELANIFCASGEYYWNSGMFLFKASRYLEELKKFRPDIYEACDNALKGSMRDQDFIKLDEEIFASCPSESIDYAVMEKTQDAVVVPMDVGWSDIGTWDSLKKSSVVDENGNSSFGDVVLLDTKNSLIRSEDKLVTTIGLNNMVVVATKDAILVASSEAAASTKDVVDLLKEDGRTEWKVHRETERPWGKYDSIDRGSRHQVKKITVNPGAKLSVQMHFHRSEHWVVVAGRARVHYGSEFRDLDVDDSTYHGKEVVHALENVGEIPLELIEIQIGGYLEEDDIVRLDDRYGRIQK
jgi:mannose-1-phosphate guanylyltransferase